jgi:N-acetylglucosaminyl-diphospho-decaprenol L-rhamnosyltransferase
MTAPETQPPLVSIVCVNFNGEDLFAAWLAGVRGSDHPRLETIVVDNASSDGSVALLAAEPDVRLVASPDNLGFGQGCNLGASHATGELLLFMNPDAVLVPDTVRVLVADLRDNLDAAVACATEIGAGVEHVREARVEDVASMAAATMMVRRDHFEALGGFDPWMFLYSEDEDLCYRTWLRGRRVLKSWDAVVLHDAGGTGGGVRWSGEQIRNVLYVYLKLRAWPAVARKCAMLLVKTAVRGVRLRDPRVLTAWTDNLRALPSTLVKRRAERGSATPEDLARLERLGAEHAYWARVGWRRRVRSGVAARLGRADGAT